VEDCAGRLLNWATATSVQMCLGPLSIRLRSGGLQSSSVVSRRIGVCELSRTTR